MLPAIVNLQWYRGDNSTQTFRFLENNTPVDLTGATVESWARQAPTVEQLTVTVDAPAGEVTIGTPNGSLGSGAWNYDIQVTAADLSVKTWVRGCINVEPDVTHATN